MEMKTNKEPQKEKDRGRQESDTRIFSRMKIKMSITKDMASRHNNGVSKSCS